MIHTSKQLKDKVRLLSKSDMYVAQALIRNFIMERFLERVAVSKYKDHFILKGGMLVAAIVGVDMRSTMDIDATIKSLPLNAVDARKIIEEICSIPLEDEISFRVTKVTDIMPDFDYPGVRIMMEARLDRLRQQFKIDISTDDVITPAAIIYEYQMMFEDRVIEVLSYNVETLLAEKMQTVLDRGIANTRMRDFYDIYILIENGNVAVRFDALCAAFQATCRKRNTIFSQQKMNAELLKIKTNVGMKELWKRYGAENYFVGNISWEMILEVLDKVVKQLVMDEK